MNVAINTSLLLLGLTGALLAFVGDTINKDGAAWRSRITKVGWLSVSLLIAACCLGVFKEVRSQRADRVRESKAQAAEHASEARARTAEVKQRYVEKQLSDLTAALESARVRAAEAERTIRTMAVDLPLETDDGYIDLAKNRHLEPRSNRTGRTLTLFPADDFRYIMFCRGGGYLSPAAIRGVFLRAGDRLYPLNQGSGSVRVAGPSRVPIRAEILNEQEEGCHMKFAVTSTGRYRGVS